MRVVGLDLSLTGTGIAVSSGAVLETRRIGTKPAGQDVAARSVRLRRLAGMIHEATVVPGFGAPDLVLVEGPAYSTAGSGIHDRAGLWWLVVARLTGQGIPVVEVPPATVKTFATGKGNADKDTVLSAAVRTFPAVQLQSNDEADALWLAALGRRHLGAPIDPWPVCPKDRARALDKVSWPLLKGTDRP